MGKTKFVDNCSATAVQGVGIAMEKVYDLLSGKFNENDVIALLPGSQYVDEFSGHPFVCHKVLVFVHELPSTIELLAKSAHSFSSYGNVEDVVEKPRVATKISKKGHSVPDLEMVENVTPFRFKVVTISESSEGKLVDCQVEKLQWAKVTGFARFWQAEYETTGEVSVNEEGFCKMKRIRKPVLEVCTPTPAMEKAVKDYLKTIIVPTEEAATESAE
ncbi:MAG: hypothetical protein J6R96_02285 [Spirochaetaceae bacterium]|nr:hypothetical protein [Spirochaetaceae bacterium]